MAANITATAGNMGSFGVEPLRSGRASELVVLTGAASAAGDTSGTYTFQTIKKPAFVEGGAFSLGSISGNTGVFTGLVALGSAVAYVRVYEALP